jgi:hypothetical protein
MRLRRITDTNRKFADHRLSGGGGFPHPPGGNMTGIECSSL